MTTDQEIIRSIIERLKKSNKISFRDNDLLKTFISGKDLTSSYMYTQDEETLIKLTKEDYQNFKQKLIKYLSDTQIYFIQLSEDSLDIFSYEDIYKDYKKVYDLQHEIDNLDIIASDIKYSDDERVNALEKMYELYNQERDILERYGE